MAYHQVVQGFEGSLGAISKVGAFEGVCLEAQGLRDRAKRKTLRELSPTPVGCNRGDTCCFKGYLGDLKKGGADRGAGGELLRRTTIAEEGEICPGTYYFQR